MPTTRHIVRDNAYLKWLRTERCVLTGRKADADQSVVAAHIGTGGKGLKTSDDETLPVLNVYHQMMHREGEISVLRRYLPDAVLREALRAYARQCYQDYLDGGEKRRTNGR